MYAIRSYYAVSHSPHFERRANLIRAIESAMEEAVDQAESVVHPPVQAAAPVITSYSIHYTKLYELRTQALGERCRRLRCFEQVVHLRAHQARRCPAGA